LRALGSGSDFTPFLQHLGIASSDMSFRRGHDDPVYHYHSVFDSEHWMETFGSVGFKRHVAIAQALGLATIQAASSPLLPLNISDYAKEISNYSQKAQKAANEAEATQGRFDLDFASLDKAIQGLIDATQSLDASLVASSFSASLTRSYNDKARSFEGLFIDEDGLPGRPWYRNCACLLCPWKSNRKLRSVGCAWQVPWLWSNTFTRAR
jgi:N-acetylated-alpha-linked acidic dipeptidase